MPVLQLIERLESLLGLCSSLIPYITLQLVNVLKNLFEIRLMTLITLIVVIYSPLSYFLYQILNPWIQQRSLDYSKYELLRAGFLKYVGRLGSCLRYIYLLVAKSFDLG